MRFSVFGIRANRARVTFHLKKEAGYTSNNTRSRPTTTRAASAK
jgi:hypothetical protein